VGSVVLREPVRDEIAFSVISGGVFLAKRGMCINYLSQKEEDWISKPQPNPGGGIQPDTNQLHRLWNGKGMFGTERTVGDGGGGVVCVKKTEMLVSIRRKKVYGKNKVK